MNARPQRRVSSLAGKSADQRFREPAPSEQTSSTTTPRPAKKTTKRAAPASQKPARVPVPDKSKRSTRSPRSFGLDASIQDRLRGAAYDLPRPMRDAGIRSLNDFINHLLDEALTRHEKAHNNAEPYDPPPTP